MQILFLILLCLFYTIYFAKAIALARQGISVDLLGRGDKPTKTINIEIMLKAITCLGAIIQFVSVVFPSLIWSLSVPLLVQFIGAGFVAIGTVFFAFSVVVMRNNWRAGFDKSQKTTLVTAGIYKISRNPAFVGFDLLYIGCAVAFPNIIMIITAVAAITAFNMQILNEEKFLAEKFGREYIEYKRKARRYM